MEINDKSQRSSGKLSASSRQAQSQPSLGNTSMNFGVSMMEKRKQEVERVKQRQAKERRVMLENEARMELIREENERKGKLDTALSMCSY